LLDVATIRTVPDIVRTALKNRGYSEDVLDEFLRIDNEWRKAVEESNQLKRLRNEVAEHIPNLEGAAKRTKIEEMKRVSDRIKELDSRTSELDSTRTEVVLNIPNIPHESVPIGRSSDDNPIVMECGRPRVFDFDPKPHSEIGEELDIIDFERGAKIAVST
jgi:seryl-tRNA synthetase